MATLFQFSIRSLLVAVAFTAVAIGALLNANAWWEAAVWGAALFALACAVALTIYRRDEGRAFWVGFCIFGWMYLCLLVYSWTPHANDGATRNDPLSQRSLITTKLTRLAYDTLLPDSKTVRAIPASNGGAPAAAFYFGTSGNEETAADVSIPAMGTRTVLRSKPVSGSPAPIVIPVGAPAIPNPNYVAREDFTTIAHALWLLAIGALGGKVCQIMYRTRPALPE
jgi:hypothetical protein